MSDDNRALHWQRNHEQKKRPVRVPVLKVNKNRDLYVHVAWVSDLLIVEKRKGVKDAFLQDLSSYRFPSPEDETKRVLTGTPWVGEVSTYKNKKVTTQLPSISSHMDIKSKKTLIKATENLNERSAFAEAILGAAREPQRKKRRTEKEVEYIKMSYDRHVACKHAKTLNEHDERLEMDLYKKFRHLSKQDLLLEMKNDEKYGFLFKAVDYPDAFAVEEYDNCLNTKSKRKTYSATVISAYVRGF